MGSAPPGKTIAAGFFPRRIGPGSSRPLRFKKAVSSGAPHALRPAGGFEGVSLPMTDGLAIARGSAPREQRKEDKTMTAIGYVTKNENGYKGQPKTVWTDCPLCKFEMGAYPATLWSVVGRCGTSLSL
jgi:hypothetical protein